MGWSTTQRFGLTHHRPQLSYKAYTLVVPLSGDSVYLIDLDGRFVAPLALRGLRPRQVGAARKRQPPRRGRRPRHPRLPNQNTLICEGTSGRLFEVTRSGEVVWEWWNPVYNTRPNGDAMGWLFRAYRYAPDYPGLAGRDLDPARLADLNRMYALA